MKYLILLSLIPSITFASFSKPEMIARFMDVDAWNTPSNTWCFSGEPVAFKGDVYLNCIDMEGSFMGRWNKSGFKMMARAGSENLLSDPVAAFNKISWYEYNEFSILRSFQSALNVEVKDVTNLGPLASDFTDSFLPLTADSFFFKNKGEQSQLWMWKDNVVTPFFNPKAGYIFTLQPGINGEIAVKIRDERSDENSPDKLWVYDGANWKVVLEDKDANPNSKWKSFRHQLTIEGNKILMIANDGSKDHLLLLTDNKVEVIATEGKELKSFDYFTPKMRAGTIVVRGEDFDGSKATYVKDEKHFRKLIAQGDIVQTDRGAGRVHYPNQHSIFYGAPGLDENGNVYLQATLTDPDYPSTLMGISLLKFTKE
mgnify:CR=1 FL=1